MFMYDTIVINPIPDDGQAYTRAHTNLSVQAIDGYLQLKHILGCNYSSMFQQYYQHHGHISMALRLDV